VLRALKNIRAKKTGGKRGRGECRANIEKKQKAREGNTARWKKRKKWNAPRRVGQKKAQ